MEWQCWARAFTPTSVTPVHPLRAKPLIDEVAVLGQGHDAYVSHVRAIKLQSRDGAAVLSQGLDTYVCHARAAFETQSCDGAAALSQGLD
jgi:hypothetical protein